MNIKETLEAFSEKVKSDEKAVVLRSACAKALVAQYRKRIEINEWVFELIKEGKMPEEIVVEAGSWGFSKAEVMRAMIMLLEEGEVLEGPEGFKVLEG